MSLYARTRAQLAGKTYTEYREKMTETLEPVVPTSTTLWKVGMAIMAVMSEPS
jgi:hypothetical protein